MTRTTPLRRMTRQFSQMRRTELRTFIVLFLSLVESNVYYTTVSCFVQAFFFVFFAEGPAARVWSARTLVRLSRSTGLPASLRVASTRKGRLFASRREGVGDVWRNRPHELANSSARVGKVVRTS